MKFYETCRKTVCVVLSVILTAVSLTVIAAEEENAAIDEKAQIMYALGIFTENENWGQALTRAEFVKMACEFIKLPPLAAYDAAFSDVPKGAQNADYIYAAAKRGMIPAGGKFYPDEEITVEEAQQIISGAVWYINSDMMQFGNGTSIVKGLNYSDSVTYENALKMFYNVSSEYAYEANITDASGRFTVTTSEKTVLEFYHNIYREKGTVEANSRTALSVGIDRTAENYVLIDGIRYNIGETDIASVLGRRVDFYYFYDADEDESTIRTYSVLESDNALTVSAEDILEDSSRNQLVYDNGTREKTVKIADDADLIYNGSAIPFNADWQIQPLDGSVTVIDRDDDGIYDIVLTTSYITYYVGGINVSKLRIYDNYIQPQLPLEDVEYRVFRDGKEIAFEEIINDTVLYIKADREYVGEDGLRYVDTQNSEYIDIYAGSKTLNGTVTKIDEDGLEILGEYYEFSGYLQSLIEHEKVTRPKAGAVLPAVFNPYGKIAAFDTNKFDTTQYGFLLRAFVDENTERLGIKILNTKNEIQFIDGADKIVIDGITYKDHEAAAAVLTSRDVISYMVNGSGQVRYINTPAEDLNGDKEDSLTLGASGKYNWRGNGQCGEDMVLSTNALIFAVPANKEGDDSKFSIISNQNSYFKSNMEYNIEGYNLDEGLCELAVVYGEAGKDSIDDNTKFFVISGITQTIDEDDEPVLELTGMFDYAEQTYRLSAEAELYEFDPDAEGNFGAEFPAEDLNAGDVVYFTTDTDGNMKTIQRCVNTDKINDYQAKTTFLHAWGVRLGKVYSVNGNAIQLGFSDTAVQQGDVQVWSTGSLTQFYVYDLKEKALRVGNTQDIVAYNKSGSITESSILFLRARYGTTHEIVIYNQ